MKTCPLPRNIKYLLSLSLPNPNIFHYLQGSHLLAYSARIMQLTIVIITLLASIASAGNKDRPFTLHDAWAAFYIQNSRYTIGPTITDNLASHLSSLSWITNRVIQRLMDSS